MGVNSSLLQRLFNKRNSHEKRIGMFGLNNAGKTTILYQLKLQKNIEPRPTIGFNVETIDCSGCLFSIWDVNSSKQETRTLWQHYSQNTCGIIYVIDAANIQQLPLVVKKLNELLSCKELSKLPFLLFANKQDLPNALSAEELMIALNLAVVKQTWAIQECCAISGVGLWEGLKQLIQVLEKSTTVIIRQ